MTIESTESGIVNFDESWLAKHGLRQCINGHVHTTNTAMSEPAIIKQNIGAISSSSSATATSAAGDGNSNLPADLPSALEKVKELTALRDSLLRQKEDSEKQVAQIQYKTRITTLKSLVPRALFRTEEDYNKELEKAYNLKGISDEEIKDLYETKLAKIDHGNSSGRMKQHGASYSPSSSAAVRISPIAAAYAHEARRRKHLSKSNKR